MAHVDSSSQASWPHGRQVLQAIATTALFAIAGLLWLNTLSHTGHHAPARVRHALTRRHANLNTPILN